MRGLLQRGKRHEANLVALVHFLQRPPHARVAGQAPAAIGRPVERGDGDRHCVTRSSSSCSNVSPIPS